MTTAKELAELVIAKVPTWALTHMAENWSRIRPEDARIYGSFDERVMSALSRLAGEPLDLGPLDGFREQSELYANAIAEVARQTGLETTQVDHALVVSADPVLSSMGILKGQISEEKLEAWRLEDEAAEQRREQLLDDIMSGKW